MKRILKIYTKRWGRGQMKNYETGKRCALGFCDEQGIRQTADWPHGIYGQILVANDYYSGKTRREKLKELFGKIGVQVRFI